jgi:hypothetical protein
MGRHCSICGKEIDIKHEGIWIRSELLCRECLGERIRIRSIWGDID